MSAIIQRCFRYPVFQCRSFRLSIPMIFVASLCLFSSGIAIAQQSPAAQNKETTPASSSADETESSTQSETEKIAAKRFKVGTEAIKLKQWDNAIENLEQAVKFSPENSNYHHALGVAYMGSKQPNAGWYHFRQAVRLEPKNVTATIDFMKTWKLLDAQGIFNVGKPLKLVAQTLGKPDQVNDRGTRLRLVYGFMSLNFINGQLLSILDLRNLPEKGLSTVDGMAFTLPEDEWIVAYRILSANQGNTEYVKKGEAIQSWTELFSSQRFINAADTKTAKDVMNGIRKRLESLFKEVSFEVIKQTDQDVLFVWSVQQNDQNVGQQEIVRIVQGEHDIHRLAYTRKGVVQQAATLEPWMKVLVQAKLLSAQELRKYLLKQQQEIQESQLRETSRQILKKQFELIRKKDINSLQLFFAQDVRGRITPEILEQVQPYLDDLFIEELIDHVKISTENGVVKAQLIDKQGETFTTLVQTDGRWFAKTIWFEALIK